MKKIIRIVTYALAFVLPIVALGTVGYFSTLSLTLPKPTDLEIPKTGVGSLITKSFDLKRPTVAVVLGSNRTEGTDFLIPYQLFSASEAYNVYAVAPERKMTSLAGGLEVMPDFSYAELKTLLGKSPDVVVIPAFPNVESPENKPVLNWIKQQAGRGSFIFSFECAHFFISRWSVPWKCLLPSTDRSLRCVPAIQIFHWNTQVACD